jgi:hypothetical protein
MATERTTQLALAAFIALVLIVVLHQPQLSLQNIMIGQGGEYPVSTMVFLKLSVGFLTSLIILSICKLFVRTLSYRSIVVAVLVQLLWIEFEWNFVVRAADLGEVLIRFAEELGAVLAGGVAIGFLRIRDKSVGDSKAQP